MNFGQSQLVLHKTNQTKTKMLELIASFSSAGVLVALTAILRGFFPDINPILATAISATFIAIIVVAILNILPAWLLILAVFAGSGGYSWVKRLIEGKTKEL